MNKNNRGLVHIYTGNGKGKTTAAIGLAVRATGRNLKVAFIQFIKGVQSGELIFMDKYKAFDIVQISAGDYRSKSHEQLSSKAQDILSYAENVITGDEYDLVVLDEICVALHEKLISVQQVLDLLDKKPQRLELVLTGRNAPQELIERADLVTEMRMIKHPYNEGIVARPGIEF
jgi:cob(I)alamin adenosyltransferase